MRSFHPATALSAKSFSRWGKRDTDCRSNWRPCRQLTLLLVMKIDSPSTGSLTPSSKIGGFRSPCCSSVPYFSLWYLALLKGEMQREILKNWISKQNVYFLCVFCRVAPSLKISSFPTLWIESESRNLRKTSMLTIRKKNSTLKITRLLQSVDCQCPNQVWARPSQVWGLLNHFWPCLM